MKRIVILGAGESGTGSAILARKGDSMCLSPTQELLRIITGIC